MGRKEVTLTLRGRQQEAWRWQSSPRAPAAGVDELQDAGKVARSSSPRMRGGRRRQARMEHGGVPVEDLGGDGGSPEEPHAKRG